MTLLPRLLLLRNCGRLKFLEIQGQNRARRDCYCLEYDDFSGVGTQTKVALKKNGNKQGQRTMNKGGTYKHGIKQERKETRKKEPQSEVSAMQNGLEGCIHPWTRMLKQV